jgi:hypothetical protein
VNEANRDRCLTVRWNNGLALGLGLPTLIYAGIVLSGSALSDFLANERDPGGDQRIPHQHLVGRGGPTLPAPSSNGS